MRRTSIIREVPTTILNKDPDQFGRSILQSKDYISDGVKYDRDYDLAVDKLPTDLVSSKELYFQMRDSRPPGDPFKSAPLTVSDTIGPSLFSQPFEYRYAFEDPQTQTGSSLAWIGQNNYGIKSYKKFFNNEAETASLKNAYMFSHNDDLYLLAESFTDLGNRLRSCVSIYKRYDEGFAKLKTFTDQPTDTYEYVELPPSVINSGGGLQVGSPCAVSIGDDFLIFYRYFDRSEGKSYILCLDSSYNERSRTPINSTIKVGSLAGSYINFRLRASYAEGVLMVAFYGTGVEQDDEQAASDFRTLISYDYGDTFQGRHDSYLSVIKVSDSQYRTETTESLFSVPTKDVDGRFKSNGNLIFSISANVNFDLYYDKKISSFVAMKSAYPNFPDSTLYGTASYDLVESDYLIGIAASISKPFDWNIVCRYKLEGKNIAIGNSDTYENFDIDMPNNTDNSMHISDVCILSDGNENFLFMTTGGLLGDYGNSITKFSFVPSENMPRAMESNPIKFGQKVHSNYVFIIDPINAQSTGFAHGGSDPYIKIPQEDLTPMRWIDPVGCIWKNGLVYSARLSETPLIVASSLSDGGMTELYGAVFNRYVSLAVAAEHSNLGEENSYEFSYPKRMRNFSAFNLNLDTTDGTMVYDLNEELNVYEGQIAHCVINNETLFPSIVDRIQMAQIPKFKTRFQLKVLSAGTDAPVQFFKALLASYRSDPSGIDNLSIDIGAAIDHTGAVKVGAKDAATGGSLRQTIAILELDTLYDIAIIVESGRGNRSYQATLFFAYKPSTTDKWNVAEYQGDVVYPALLPPIDHRILAYGIIDSISEDWSIGIGDIHISAYSSGYQRQFVEYNVGAAKNEPIATRNTVSKIATRSARSYGASFPVGDGSIRMTSFIGTGYRVNKFALVPSRQRNSVKNLQSDSADLVYQPASSEAPTESFIFKIESFAKIDSACLINCAGIKGVTISTGKYDESGVWLAKTSQVFEWPKEQLIKEGAEGNTLLISREIANHEFFGRYIQGYSSGTAQGQTMVIDNLDEFIELEDGFSFSVLGLDPYIHDKNAIFNLGLIPDDHTHVEVVIDKILFADIFIGRILFGTKQELTDCIVSHKEDVYSYDKTKTSNTGYSFNGYNKIVSISQESEFSVPQMIIDEPYFSKVVSCINEVALNKKQICVLQESTGFRQIYYGAISDISLSQSGRHMDLSFSVSSSNNISRPEDYRSKQFDIDLINDAELIVNESVQFMGRSTLDDQLFISYSWDFGDGNTNFGAIVTNTYSDIGSYTVTLTATDQFGNEVIVSKQVEVTGPYISDYTLSRTGGPTSFTIQIEAVDKNLDTVETDDRILYLSSPSIQVLKLASGVASFGLTSTVGTTINVSFEDSSGKPWLKRITL